MQLHPVLSDPEVVARPLQMLSERLGVRPVGEPNAEHVERLVHGADADGVGLRVLGPYILQQEGSGFFAQPR